VIHRQLSLLSDCFLICIQQE